MDNTATSSSNRGQVFLIEVDWTDLEAIGPNQAQIGPNQNQIGPDLAPIGPNRGRMLLIGPNQGQTGPDQGQSARIPMRSRGFGVYGQDL